MNLSEVHSLSPAFPDVGGRVMAACTAGGKKSYCTGPNNQKKKE